LKKVFHGAVTVGDGKTVHGRLEFDKAQPEVIRVYPGLKNSLQAGFEGPFQQGVCEEGEEDNQNRGNSSRDSQRQKINRAFPVCLYIFLEGLEPLYFFFVQIGT
jgi:hypothetical protein